MFTKSSFSESKWATRGSSFGKSGGVGAPFAPDDLDNLVAWYQFNIGITVTGAGVSTWADQSGNGNDLLQSTDADRPSHESDGTILFEEYQSN